MVVVKAAAQAANDECNDRCPPRFLQQEPNPQTIAGTARVSLAAPNDAKLRIPWHEDLIRKALSQSVMLHHLPPPWADAVDPIRIDHIRQRHDSFQLVQIRTMDDRQDIEMVFAHALERQMQGMICVDVRNMKGFHKTRQWLLSPSIDKGALKIFLVQDPKKVSLVGYGPDAEGTGASLFNCLLNAHLRGEHLRRLPHDLGH